MKKLSPATLLLGIFAVLFGLLGAYAVKQHLQREQPEQAEAEPAAKLSVPLASAELVAGRTLTAGDVMLKKMTHAEIKKQGIPANFMMNSRQLIGRTLREPVAKGRAFATTDFYPEGTGPSVASRLKPGHRAVTIAMEDDMAAAGLVTPGSAVDVIFRTTSNQKKQLPETTVTLLENVEVLAIGQETFQGARPAGGQGRGGAASTTVSLAVTPRQASALKTTEGHGSLSLALRGPDDLDIAGTVEPATLTSVLGLAEPEKPFTTQIYRRGRLSTTVFEDGRRSTIHDPSIPAITASKKLPVPGAAQAATTGADRQPKPVDAKAISNRKVRSTRTPAAKGGGVQSASCCGDT